jgi:hypothetical protein
MKMYGSMPRFAQNSANAGPPCALSVIITAPSLAQRVDYLELETFVVIRVVAVVNEQVDLDVLQCAWQVGRMSKDIKRPAAPSDAFRSSARRRTDEPSPS